MTTALLDGDIIVYRAASVAQQTWEDGDGDGMIFDPRIAFVEGEKIIADWTRRAGCDRPVICFSSSEGNFRHHIYPRYKANRIGKEKPRAYQQLVARLRHSYKWFRIPGLEADDVLGILGTSPKWEGSVVVSLDKDMKTLPCRVFNPGTRARKPALIRRAQADYHWLMQTLCGDATDNYPGLPGTGPAGAEKILAPLMPNFAAMWSATVAAFEKKGLTEEDAITQARLARILRRDDYNKEREEIQLWHPTTPVTLALSSVLRSSPSTVAPGPASPKSPATSSETED
jgi:DNA polymerase I